MRPRVELLRSRGRPSRERALSELRGQMEELGLDPRAVALLEGQASEPAVTEPAGCSIKWWS